MKPQDLANLLNRAAAAIETLRGKYPFDCGDLTANDFKELIEDLVLAAKEACE